MGRRTYLLLWFGSLALIGGSGLLFRQPGYMDAYYYFHVAANLADGRGLVEDIVWNYLAPVDAIPHPSNLYWMPLTSFVAAPAMAVFGQSFRAAQLPLVLVAALAPVATAAVVWDLWRERWLALTSAALTLFGGFYFYYWSAIDSFGVFVLASLLGLWATARLSTLSDACKGSTSPGGGSPAIVLQLDIGPGKIGWPGSTPALALVLGMAAGAAHLARADGLLVLGAGMMFLLLMRSPGWPAVLVLAIVLLGYLLVMGPWYLRTWAETGSLAVPGTATTMFLQDYNSIFSYQEQPSLQSYLAWGAGPILLSKLRAFAENLVVLHGGALMLLPFSVIGAWVHRRDLRLLPFFLYAALMFFFLTIVFTFPGARGSMRHSGVALLPWLSVLSLLGIRAVVAWLAPRRPHWRPGREEKGFAFIALGASAALSIAFLVYNAGAWDHELQHYQAVAAWLQVRSAGYSPVMVTDPPAFHYVSGRYAVVTPSDGVGAVVAAADKFGVEYVALEAAHDPSLRGLYTGDEQAERLSHQDWVGTTHMFKVLR